MVSRQARSHGSHGAGRLSGVPTLCLLIPVGVTWLCLFVEVTYIMHFGTFVPKIHLMGRPNPSHLVVRPSSSPYPFFSPSLALSMGKAQVTGASGDREGGSQRSPRGREDRGPPRPSPTKAFEPGSAWGPGTVGHVGCPSRPQGCLPCLYPQPVPGPRAGSQVLQWNHTWDSELLFSKLHLASE